VKYDKVFPATWVSDDGRSYSSADARRLGYWSATKWKARNRVPDPSAVPSLVVSKVGRGSGDPCAPILRVLPGDEYEYAAEFYCVYPEADTVPAPEGRKSRKSVIIPAVVQAELAPESWIVKTIDQQTDPCSFFSPESTPPYDVGFSRKAIQGKDLATKTTAGPADTVNKGASTTKRERKAEEWEYLPEDFDWSKVPKALAGGVRYFFHLIYLNKVIINRSIKTTEYVNLNAQTFRRIVWNGDQRREGQGGPASTRTGISPSSACRKGPGNGHSHGDFQEAAERVRPHSLPTRGRMVRGGRYHVIANSGALTERHCGSRSVFSFLIERRIAAANPASRNVPTVGRMSLPNRGADQLASQPTCQFATFEKCHPRPRLMGGSRFGRGIFGQSLTPSWVNLARAASDTSLSTVPLACQPPVKSVIGVKIQCYKGTISSYAASNSASGSRLVGREVRLKVALLRE